MNHSHKSVSFSERSIRSIWLVKNDRTVCSSIFSLDLSNSFFFLSRISMSNSIVDDLDFIGQSDNESYIAFSVIPDARPQIRIKLQVRDPSFMIPNPLSHPKWAARLRIDCLWFVGMIFDEMIASEIRSEMCYTLYGNNYTKFGQAEKRFSMGMKNPNLFQFQQSYDHSLGQSRSRIQ